MNCDVIHFTPSALFAGLSSNPDRKHSDSNRGNPRNKPTAHRVRKLLWKRSLGLSITKSAASAGWKSSNPAREILRHTEGGLDAPRGAAEVRESVVFDYQSGETMPSLSMKYGYGVSTISRWIDAANTKESASSRKALYLSKQPRGADVVGKKGILQTSKGGHWVATDSVYEFAWVDALEALDDVVDIQRCRRRFPYNMNGKSRTYTPDFEVIFSDGSIQVHEVKPAKWRNDPTVIAKASAAAAALSEVCIGYRIVSEDEIGVDRIARCSTMNHDRLDPRYVDEMRERRLLQKRAAAVRYYDKFRVRPRATPKS